MAKKMGWWKKMRRGLRLIDDVVVVANLWPYVHGKLKTEYAELLMELEKLAEEDEQVGAFRRAADNIITEVRSWW